MEQSVPIKTGFEKLKFFSKLSESGSVNRRQRKKEGEKQWQKEKSNPNLSVSTVSNLKD